jgi:pyruvate formate lyase activating enzyme
MIALQYEFPIVSIIPDSFQEYENEWSLVVFSANCNMKCPECYNYLDVTTKNPIGSAIDIIKANIRPCHTAVTFLGGEPTIWKEGLITTASSVKSMGLKVKVFTNGLLPFVIHDMNKLNLLDACSVDLKCVRDSKNVIGIDIEAEVYLSKLKLVAESCIASKVNLEFRTTKWDCVLDQLPEIISYASTNFPQIPHILQNKFSI